MSSGLFGFIFNTLWKRLNNPRNTKLWVPKMLQGVDNESGPGKLLPLKESKFNIGDITGEAGALFRDNMIGQWWVGLAAEYGELKGTRLIPNAKVVAEQRFHQPIPCPEQPWPQLTLSDLTVYGLDNTWVLPDPLVTQPGTGYRAIITIQFGRYPDLRQVEIEGDYLLQQCACSALATEADEPKPTTCDKWFPTEHIDGEGTFKTTLTNVFADVEIEVLIAGTDPARRLQLSVNHITIRGPQPGSVPPSTVTDLTVKTTWAYMANKVWIPHARKALESEDGRRGLIKNLNTSLNKQSTREQFARLFEEKLNQAFDDAFATVPAGGLPSATGQGGINPFDQYVFDRMRVAFNNPDSDFYLPKMICGFTSPQLEPYQIERISLGNQNYEGIEFQDAQFLQCLVTGFSNNQAPVDQMSMAPIAIDARLSVSTLAPPPQVTVSGGETRQVPDAPLTMAGRFSMSAQDLDGPIDGGFTVKFRRSNLVTTVDLSGDELDDSGRGLRSLKINFQKLQLEAPLSEASIELHVDSEFGDIINQVLNKDEIKSKAVQSINNQAVQSLGEISRTATENVSKTLASRLDG